MYVARPDDPLATVAKALELEQRAYRVLIGGQRGVGKTTSLLRVQRMLRDAGVIVAFDGFPTQKTKAGQPPPVALFDGAERSSPSEVLGSLWTMKLSIPELSIVHVVPVSLLLGAEHAAAIADWDQRLVLSAVAVRDRQGGPNPLGVNNLVDVLERRAGLDVFVREAVELIVDASGGIHSELIHIAKRACLRAMLRNGYPVELRDAQSAITDRRNELSFQITRNDIEYLRLVEETGALIPDERSLSLLERNLIVHYSGNPSWFDAHPIVKPIIHPETLKSSTSR